MELRDALTQISEIHSQMVRAQVFRGYRSITTAFSGLVALLATAIQTFFIPQPPQQIYAYVGLWFGAAILCMAVVGAEMILRSRRLQSKLQSQLTLLAVEQFVPTVIAGALLTAVLIGFVPEAIYLLPGLWLILFSLGVFASCRLLPRAAFYVAGYYLLAGLSVLMIARGPFALHPLAMGLPFGLGQLLTAAMLYHTLERGGERGRHEK